MQLTIQFARHMVITAVTQVLHQSCPGSWHVTPSSTFRVAYLSFGKRWTQVVRTAPPRPRCSQLRHEKKGVKACGGMRWLDFWKGRDSVTTPCKILHIVWSSESLCDFLIPFESCKTFRTVENGLYLLVPYKSDNLSLITKTYHLSLISDKFSWFFSILEKYASLRYLKLLMW